MSSRLLIPKDQLSGKACPLLSRPGPRSALLLLYNNSVQLFLPGEERGFGKREEVYDGLSFPKTKQRCSFPGPGMSGLVNLYRSGWVSSERMVISGSKGPSLLPP